MLTYVFTLPSKALQIIGRNRNVSPIGRAIAFLLKKAVDAPPIYTLIMAIVKCKLRRDLMNLRNLNDAVNFVFNFNVLGIDIRPSQVKEEITELLEILAKHKPRFILEIGTARGGTLFLFCMVAAPNATIISVDMPKGPFGGGYPESKIPFYKTFAREKQTLLLIRADSHNLKTLENVKRVLHGEKLDFIFIDGDHTYDGVRMDFEMYSPFVKEGGIIAFHDVAPHNKIHDPHGKVGVPQFWNEIKRKYRHLEIVKN